MRRCGETGKHKALKMLRPNGFVGSTPTIGTTKQSLGAVLFYGKHVNRSEIENQHDEYTSDWTPIDTEFRDKSTLQVFHVIHAPLNSKN